MSSARANSGQDLLGLRSPAERLSNEALDGVNTVTPRVRYLSLRSWIIDRYARLKGPDDERSFSRFAQRCEFALAIGHALLDAAPLAVIGSRKASEWLERYPTDIPLDRVGNSATDVYAGAAVALGLTSQRAGTPGLSRERGLPLASTVADILDGSALGDLDVDERVPTISRAAALELAQRFPLAAPQGRERDVLIDAVLPIEPRKGELPRLRTYGLLLWLADGLGREPTESDLFRLAVDGGRSGRTAGWDDTLDVRFAGTLDTWLRFLVRDQLALMHEWAVRCVVDELRLALHAQALIERVLGNLRSTLSTKVLASLGCTGLSLDTPVATLAAQVEARTAEIERPFDRGGLARWSDALDELLLIETRDQQPSSSALSLLPLVWILAERRCRPGLTMGAECIDVHSGTLDRGRLPVRSLIAPTVQAWRDDGTTIADATLWLVRRSVDQHLSIAWTRLGVDPSKDVARLAASDDRWEICSDRPFNAERSSSRVYQAIAWLVQLGLVHDDSGPGPRGLTDDGRTMMRRTFETLAAPGGSS